MAARKARKRTTKKSKAVAVVGRSDLALPSDLQDEFAEFVNRDKASAVAAGWPFLSTQGATPVMSVGGQPVGCDRPGREHTIVAVVLGGVRANQYYAGEFTPGKPTPPVCYAIADPMWEAGEVEGKLAPPADLKSKEADTCAECRYNAFGSGRGNAKACKNTVKLAMLPAGSDDFAKADGFMLSAPPTVMKAWAAYVAPLAAMRRPVMTVITEVEKIPSETGAGFSLGFTTLDLIQDKTDLRSILARAKGDGGAALVQPPPAAEASGAKPQRRRKVVKKAKKKARKK
jgi:hypothetical protein